jgi:chromosomal replication initiator protein
MDVWARVLSAVGKRVSQQSFDTWFRPIAFVGRDDTSLRIRVPNETFRKWLLDNYARLLDESVRECLGKLMQVVVLVENPAAGVSAAPSPAAPPELHPQLNARYTFGSFVVGASNQFACAAAMAVAERPSKAYNPLYIYGGVGLGKTHLMHAIGHFIIQRNSRLKLAYMSSERFMNELVNAIRYDRTIQFREKYRSIDVLLMDDAQFISKWERTQEEFFHTFNALYDAQKQIVITSDCPPKDIPTIEERLHSRFQWGLIADIQAPDLETKIAILRKKSEIHLPTLPDSVAMYLAGSIRSSIRELEGALIRLSARASLEVLRDVVRDEKRAITTEMVIQAVAGYFGLKPAQLKSKNNARAISEPRQIAMYFCKELTSLSLPQIGREFGGKHHTTVLHSIRKIADLKKSDPSFSSSISKILKSLD